MPLPWVVYGIWKVAESSRTKEEDREVWAQESRMRVRESACKILSPLPTLKIHGKVSCAVLGAVTPCASRITRDM
jgi:hypothetical protein